MKVLIDAHMVGSKEGGNERYITALIAELGKIMEVEALVQDTAVRLPGAKRKIKVSRINLVRYLYEIPRAMKRGHYDLVLTTYFVVPAWAKQNVVMIHDLLPLRNPEYFSWKERIQFLLLGYSIKHAKAVIVPSGFTAHEIKHFYPEESHKVVVIREAASAFFKPYSSGDRKMVRARNKLKDLSVLILASRFAKRPIEGVLLGLQLLDQPVKAVVLGAPKVRRKSQSGRVEVKYLDKISEVKLRDYYNGVDMVIYPSRYEGFGLPVLEAMACKTIVLATKIPPVWEIAGKTAVYFDLEEPRSLERAVKKILNDPKYRSKQIELGYNVARLFSWEKTAKQTKAMFMKLAQKI
jgi:glycosyltransferase involved in cell wall biosynthesis